jgi:hypothetical protein
LTTYAEYVERVDAEKGNHPTLGTAAFIVLKDVYPALATHVEQLPGVNPNGAKRINKFLAWVEPAWGDGPKERKLRGRDRKKLFPGGWQNPLVVAENDDYQLVRLRTEADLILWAKRQGHCGGSHTRWAILEGIWQFHTVLGKKDGTPYGRLLTKDVAWVGKAHPLDCQHHVYSNYAVPCAYSPSGYYSQMKGCGTYAGNEPERGLYYGKSTTYDSRGDRAAPLNVNGRLVAELEHSTGGSYYDEDEIARLWTSWREEARSKASSAEIKERIITGLTPDDYEEAEATLAALG